MCKEKTRNKRKGDTRLKLYLRLSRVAIVEHHDFVGLLALFYFLDEFSFPLKISRMFSKTLIFLFMMDELPTIGYLFLVVSLVGFKIRSLSEASFDSVQPILSFDIISSENRRVHCSCLKLLFWYSKIKVGCLLLHITGSPTLTSGCWLAHKAYSLHLFSTMDIE